MTKLNDFLSSMKLPSAFWALPILNKWVYKVYYGGRGGAKSHSMARVLISIALTKKKRVVCAKETFVSIEDSSYTLLCDIIKQENLDEYFKITNDIIISLTTGSEIKFKGFRASRKTSEKEVIKSLEGIDICWIDEAQFISLDTLMMLLPTVRNQDSEIWFSMNRITDNDAVFKYFSGNHSIVSVYMRKVLFTENPFRSETFEKTRIDFKEKHPELYDHVYLGEPLGLYGESSIIPLSSFLAAQNRHYEEIHYYHNLKIMGVDVGHEGNDDSVIFKRQGIQVIGWKKYRRLDGAIEFDTKNNPYPKNLKEIIGVGKFKGMQVCVIDEGKVYKNITVTGNSVFMPFPVRRGFVGLPYTSTIIPNALITAEGGTSIGMIQRINKIILRLIDSNSFLYGSKEDNLKRAPFKRGSDDLNAPPALFTGDYELQGWQGDYEKDAKIIIKNDMPLPLNIQSIIAEVETYD